MDDVRNTERNGEPGSSARKVRVPPPQHSSIGLALRKAFDPSRDEKSVPPDFRELLEQI